MITKPTATFTALSLAALLGTAAAQTAQTPTPIGTSGATGAAPTTRTSPTTADYHLVTGDKLRIDVYKDQQLSQSLQIRPDGKITLPLVGDVAAAGHTSLELRDAIAASLKEYIANPVVTVIVLETTPQVVYVQGEVTRPGVFALNGRLSIIQAIALAGGFTDFANRKDITILRGTEKLKFNYKDAIDDDTRREPLALQPGDTVIVK
ncbi:MAG TPA: polysaccharide biosynthesis/export family protein [Vicinamibacterales bacterium]|jgi:polysaccharide export outer membrane protein